jgi:hypothetical protein
MYVFCDAWVEGLEESNGEVSAWAEDTNTSPYPLAIVHSPPQRHHSCTPVAKLCRSLQVEIARIDNVHMVSPALNVKLEQKQTLKSTLLIYLCD